MFNDYKYRIRNEITLMLRFLLPRFVNYKNNRVDFENKYMPTK